MQKSKVRTQKSDDTSVTPKKEETSVKSKVTKKTPAAEPTSMEELLSQTGYQLSTNKRGDMVKATVISMTAKRLTLDIGGKSEAVVHEKEMPYVSDLVSDLKPGDTIEVSVVNPENDRGQTVVSLRRTAVVKRWDLLSSKLKSGETVDVIIREMSRGGFLIDYFGIRGFIPLSQVEPEFARLGERAQGRKVAVKVIEVDKAANRLVLSQSSHSLSSEKQKELLKKVEIGATYNAEVTGIAPFGAFVSVKVDSEATLPGLIHISEISWEKVDSPSSYLSQGQKVEVKAIGADAETGKLTLSLKQLMQDPWEDVVKVLSVDQTIKGKVSKVTEFGIFVEVLPGIDGLIHISKLAPGEEPKKGEEIDVTIEEINAEKRKIGLAMVSLAKPIGYR